MDEYIRRLERRAASGDYEAHELQLRQAARIGLIPSQAQLQSMHHGWVEGNTNDPNPNAAAEFILETWKTLLEVLGQRAYAWYQSYYNDPESGDEYDDSEFDYENFGIELQNLSKGFVDPDSVFSFLEPLHEYINGFLESTSDPKSGWDNIPLVLKGVRGDFEGGRVTDVDVSYTSPHGLSLKFSIARGVDLYGGFIPLVDMEWNTAQSRGDLVLFNNLPSSLYQLPPLWESWGAGSYLD